MKVIAFYQFHSIAEHKLPSLREFFFKLGRTLNIRGLLIFGTEGVNGTLCGTASAVSEFQVQLEESLGVALTVKESQTHFVPFPKLKVKIRREIVTSGDEKLQADQVPESYLTPAQWQEILQSDSQAVVLDTRNWYETRLGKFKRALDPGLNCFQEFAEFLPKSGLNKDQKILIYCTGGIRCEKAIVEMRRQGFQNVYQLQGGILNYLQHYTQADFQGECFVFDYRVAVDQSLQPTERYRLCPHCGQPGDVPIRCTHCGKDSIICDQCQAIEFRNTCSKNCAHHHREGHRFRGRKPAHHSLTK